MQRLALLALFLFTPLPALAIGAAWPLSDNPRFWILGEGFGHFSLDGYYFQTRENYDVSGLGASPANLGSLHYANIRAHAGFGIAPTVSLFAQADGRSVAMTGQEAASPLAPIASNIGLGDAFLGFRWLVYRSSASNRVYPTEWAPATFVAIAEGTWTFPMYSTASGGKPPLGDQSNDFSSIGRVAWYANEWLAFSAGAGYIYRTAGYAGEIPWNIRADFALRQKRFRFWTELQSLEGMNSAGGVVNVLQPDPLPDGSLLFKSYSPTLRTATLGTGYLLSREWELVAGGFFTASGVNAAKGYGAGLGFTWRPYQVPEIKYDEYRQRQIERLQSEKQEVHSRRVVRYGQRATIVKVSTQGNFVKIFYGEKDKIKIGDTFYVLPPDQLNGQLRRPVASAKVAQVSSDAAYLHVEDRYIPDVNIQEGFEAVLVYFDQED